VPTAERSRKRDELTAARVAGSLFKKLSGQFLRLLLLLLLLFLLLPPSSPG